VYAQHRSSRMSLRAQAGNWTTAQKLGNLKNYYPRRANHNTHVADASDSDDDSDNGGGAGAATSNETKSAYVSSSGNTRGGQRPPAGFPGASNKSRANPPRQIGPKGKLSRDICLLNATMFGALAPPRMECAMSAQALTISREIAHITADGKR
jgi:hypothetical protein